MKRSLTRLLAAQWNDCQCECRDRCRAGFSEEPGLECVPGLRCSRSCVTIQANDTHKRRRRANKTDNPADWIYLVHSEFCCWAVETSVSAGTEVELGIDVGSDISGPITSTGGAKRPRCTTCACDTEKYTANPATYTTEVASTDRESGSAADARGLTPSEQDQWSRIQSWTRNRAIPKEDPPEDVKFVERTGIRETSKQRVRQFLNAYRF